MHLPWESTARVSANEQGSVAAIKRKLSIANNRPWWHFKRWAQNTRIQHAVGRQLREHCSLMGYENKELRSCSLLFLRPTTPLLLRLLLSLSFWCVIQYSKDQMNVLSWKGSNFENIKDLQPSFCALSLIFPACTGSQPPLWSTEFSACAWRWWQFGVPHYLAMNGDVLHL